MVPIATATSLRNVMTLLAACLLITGCRRSHPAHPGEVRWALSPQPDGEPFFWLGDTGWELFQRLNREEADLYLQRPRQ